MVKCGIIRGYIASSLKEVIKMRASERSLRFKEAFLEMSEKGVTVREIAEDFGLSRVSAYRLIREIAEETGVDYNSLLYQPHATHVCLGTGKIESDEKVKPVDFSEFEREFRNGISAFDKAIYQMDKTLKKWPETYETLDGGLKSE